MAPLPRLGVGLGYRAPLRADILRHVKDLDFLEVIADAFFREEPMLRALRSMTPCVPHALALSVGSEVRLDYLERVARVVEVTDPPWFTDHLAFTQEGDVPIGHLAPVPHTEESLRVVVDNVRKVMRRIQRPFGLENITMPFYWPGSTLDEATFLQEVVKQTGCLLLLDLENVRVNAENHGRVARDFLDRLPLERVVQVHLAGGVHAEGLHHDTHSAPVSQETWDLLEYLCDVAPPAGVLIERDAGFPPFADLLGEVRHARSILEGAAA